MKVFKKLAFVSAATLSLALLAGSAYASGGGTYEPQHNIYVGVIGGVGFAPDIDFDGVCLEYDYPGYQLGFNIGLKRDAFRFEGEFLYSNSDYDDLNIRGLGKVNINGDTHVYAGMFNAYYDFDNVDFALKPYLGLGIGYARVENKLGGLKFDDDTFAFQAIAGVNYHINDHFTLSGDYRYFITSKVGKGGESFQNHMLNLGLHYYV